jgi:hypothetical protein
VNKLIVAVAVLIGITVFVSRMKGHIEEERLYLVKFSGGNDVSTIVLAKSNRSINLEEASDNFIKNFMAECKSCSVVEKGFIENTPVEYKGVFEKKNGDLNYTLMSAKGIEFVIVEYEGTDNVSLYNCKKRKSNVPSNFPINITCVGS